MAAEAVHLIRSRRANAYKAMKRKGHLDGGPFSHTAEERSQPSDGTGATTRTVDSASADCSSSMSAGWCF